MTKNRHDLDLAVKGLDASTAVLANNPARMTNLGNALLSRYGLTKNLADVERAVELQDQQSAF